MHNLAHVTPFNAICKLGCGVAGEHKMYFGTEPNLSEGLHHTEFILMALTVADGEEVWKRESIVIPFRAIRGIDTTTDIVDFVRRNSRPFDNLQERKFRNREDA